MRPYYEQLKLAKAAQEAATCSRPEGHCTLRESAECPKHFCTCATCLSNSPFAVEAKEVPDGR